MRSAEDKRRVLIRVVLVCFFLLAIVLPAAIYADAPIDVGGEIVVWGSMKLPDKPLTNLTQIAAGGAYSLGLKTDGSIVVWGRNDEGQWDVPLPNEGFTAIAGGGGNHSLGLKSDGSIAAWGTEKLPDEPLTNFTHIAAHGHLLGLKTDGSVMAWGGNRYGQCDVPSPNTNFAGIVAGGSHSLGLKIDGSIVAWGRNDDGQCDVPLPNTGFTAIAAGDHHSLVLKTDGSIVAWGDNDDGECDVPLPNAGFTAIAAGGSYYLRSPHGHSLGLKADGSIVAWGDNGEGQCDVPSPNTGFTGIAAGDAHSLGLKIDGSIVAWGRNNSGQCNVPSPNAGFTAVAASGHHSLGLKTDGSIVAWGSNLFGQCDVPLPNTGFTAIAAGDSYSLGLRGSALVPVLHGEPELTLGTSNSISWDPAVGNIEYYVECAEDPNFNSVVCNSGWITETSCEFIDLQTGQQYWYRVKAKNAAGVESQWSNVESSLQSTLGDAVDVLLDPASLKNENMKNALLNKIDAALAMIEEGNYTGALSKLEHDILAKTNGCAETGEPDKNDWILTCEQQSQVYGLVVETIEYVRSLIE